MDRKMLAFDVVVLVVYLAAANPAITGIGAHEWLGLGVCLVLVAHAAISGGRALGARRPHRRGARRLRGVGRHGVGRGAARLRTVRRGLLLLGPSARRVREGPARPSAGARGGALEVAGGAFRERKEKKGR